MNTTNSENPPLCEVHRFLERDIDVWLAEELKVSPRFCRWFGALSGLPEDTKVPAERVRISVMSENGETDVEAIFETKDGRKIALLAEDKIEHSISADQLERYRRRGQYGVTYRLWDAFFVVVFAPAAKLAKYSRLLNEVPHISFEQAAEFLVSDSAEPRNIYRAEFLAHAAMEKTLDVEGADAFRVEFWNHVYAMVDERYEDFFDLNRKRFPKTTYLAPKTHDAPNYFRVDLKGAQGQVDLAFTDTQAAALLTYLEKNKPDGASIVFNKKSIALQIADLPKFNVGDGLEIIETKVPPSFDAAQILLTFWREHRDFFDAHYGVSMEAREAGGETAKASNAQRDRDAKQTPERTDPLYSLTLPPGAIKTARYIIVKDYGDPPKERWFDLERLDGYEFDEQSARWTITAPRTQFSRRGVLEDAQPAED